MTKRILLFFFATVLGAAVVARADGPSPDQQLGVLKSQVAALQAALAASSGHIAIVDIDKIARELGVTAGLQEQTARQEAAAKQQLQASYEQLRKEVEEAKAKLGPFPTAQQQQAFARQQAEATQQLRKQEADLRSAIVAHRTARIETFQKAIRPCIAKVAADRDAAIVLTRTPVILWSREAVDITDAVLQAARKAGVK